MPPRLNVSTVLFVNVQAVGPCAYHRVMSNESRSRRVSKKTGRRLKRAVALSSTLFVSDLQVGYCSGTMTLVANDHNVGSEPMAVVIPGEATLSFLADLREAVSDAEEWYWPHFAPWLGAVARKLNGDAAAIADELESWHRTQGWDKGIKAAQQQADSGLALLTHVGHVALLAFPPFSPRPVVLIFDPTQLRRMDSSLNAMSTRAAETADPSGWRVQVLEAHRRLEADPAPDLTRFVQPTPGEAVERQRAIYEDFLRRSPHLRAQRHNLDLGEES